jgi:hypothetical protein
VSFASALIAALWIQEISLKFHHHHHDCLTPHLVVVGMGGVGGNVWGLSHKRLGKRMLTQRKERKVCFFYRDERGRRR